MTAPTAAMLRAETIGDIVKRLRAAGQVMKESGDEFFVPLGEHYLLIAADVEQAERASATAEEGAVAGWLCLGNGKAISDKQKRDLGEGVTSHYDVPLYTSPSDDARDAVLEEAAKALDSEVAHIKDNSTGLRKWEWMEHEARSRELGAMYVKECADMLRQMRSDSYLNRLNAAIKAKE